MSSEQVASTFLILHGWRNYRPPGHWQFELANDLRTLEEDVRYPQLVNADAPILTAWLDQLRQEWENIPSRNERIVIAHSLGTSLWLHAVAELGLEADRVLLVAPAGPSLLREELLLSSFAPLPEGIDGSNWRLVCSDDDPYCVEGAAGYFGEKYGCDTDVIPGAVHFALDDGYGRWPSALAWCLDPEIRLVAR
ncbi:MAG TPA: alpha/beta hydrolase [Candidatus Nanopelagicaceae bacterium]|nr:alpha/beta hydrolase [Candidatus Nanopelagicaceae bacterium]